MVSVRKLHHITVQSFEQWLNNLALTDVKVNALSALWLKVSTLYQHESSASPLSDDKLVLLHKSMEMVEILSALNLDAYY